MTAEKLKAFGLSMSPKKWMVSIAIVSFLAGAIFFSMISNRYSMVNAGGGKVYQYDRWTGKVWVIYGSNSREVDKH